MNVNLTIHGQGKPLVFFHGWGFDSHIWHPLIAKLEKHHQLFLVDLPGFGLTPSMAWEQFKFSLTRELPNRFALVGWSMGGMFATRLALEEPQIVTHLMNVTTSPRFIKDIGWPGVDKRIFQAFYQNLTQNPEKGLAQFIKLQLQGQTDVVVNAHPPALEGLQAGLELLLHWDLRQDLFSLDIPVCYLFGRLDAITPYLTMSAMGKIYPQFSYILLPRAAHAPFLSHPDQFIAELEKFLW
ncbi:alpha/beta fold hydrolase [Legionella londiniensis]|uniref:Pimeloyl-[acyl-carrier protein] methyl ester esterase n=1 Tax=Legionella londiniensis TaxID=45068 RepID=A0A0W0VLH2_9GAMM|nr:alpha/beta fold hydrolase [Legionella londiniensis]KTD20678.1 biotin biosynthesis protein BioH [Legionella londiniensis]STX92850.1 biotin operon repressor and biotin [Legionella londiniensis]